MSEPHLETRELLRRLVVRLGHELVDADADVVLVEDVEDGPGAVGLARQASPDARVIVCSILQHDRAALDAVGADAFLLKPLGLAELRSAIDDVQACDQLAGGAASISRSLPGASGRAKW